MIMKRQKKLETDTAGSIKVPQNTLQHLEFSELVRLFRVWFLAQSVVLAVLGLLFPDFIVLGTQSISPFFAVMYSMFVLTLFAVGAVPLIELLQDSKHQKLGTTEWMLLYIAVNSSGLWLISRYASQLGLGLSSWIVAAVVGILFSFVQGFFAVRTQNT